MAIAQIISDISNEFLKEARNSPKLLTDMAAMEMYMAESYSGRIFVELVQNADDCDSHRVLIKEESGNLYFANDGRPFDESDINAICRSGASSKQRGVTIGYRGIGFKSTTYLSNEIVIYSADTYFTFSKSKAAAELGLVGKNVPTVRIPFIVESTDAKIQKVVDNLVMQGYSTVFVFRNANTCTLQNELAGISFDYFLFLRNVAKCQIETTEVQKAFSINRKQFFNGENVSITGEEVTQWRIFRNDVVEVCFALDDNYDICPCQPDLAIYHSYLPTLDKAPYHLKINGDFSTDPSRKHITLNDLTRSTLVSVAELLAQLINESLSAGGLKKASRLLHILKGTMSFSAINMFLQSELERKVKGMAIKLNGDQECNIADYKLFPGWLEPSEVAYIRSHSSMVGKLSLSPGVYEANDELDGFMSKYTKEELGIDELAEIMEDGEFVSDLSDSTKNKLISHLLKDSIAATKYSSGLASQKALDVATTLLPAAPRNAKGNTGGRKELIVVDEDLADEIDSTLSLVEKKWLREKTGITLVQPEDEDEDEEDDADGSQDYAVSSNAVVRVKERPSPFVSKWRSKELSVIEIEEYFGFKATDVSKQNLGYDVESLTSDGHKRRIEVKSIESLYSEFALTSNEFAAANQYGDEYYICLLTAKEALYIQNPAKKLSFEKRSKQWEYVCEKYQGDIFTLA